MNVFGVDGVAGFPSAYCGDPAKSMPENIAAYIAKGEEIAADQFSKSSPTPPLPLSSKSCPSLPSSYSMSPPRASPPDILLLGKCFSSSSPPHLDRGGLCSTRTEYRGRLSSTRTEYRGRTERKLAPATLSLAGHHVVCDRCGRGEQVSAGDHHRRAARSLHCWLRGASPDSGGVFVLGEDDEKSRGRGADAGLTSSRVRSMRHAAHCRSRRRCINLLVKGAVPKKVGEMGGLPLRGCCWCSWQGMALAKAASDKLGVPLHIHLHESETECTDWEAANKERPVPSPPRPRPCSLEHSPKP